MVTQKIRLGSQETKLIFSLEEKRVRVFTADDAKNILDSTDASAWNVLEGLKRKKRIQQIEKGKYLLVPARAGYKGYWTEEAWVIVPSLIDTYYIGFWTAMNYWGMTEQIPRTVFVVTTKRKRGMEFGNQGFKFITLAKKKFFGYTEEKSNDIVFNISSKEKTIVDSLMHPEYCGGMAEVVKAMWTARESVDWKGVLEMAKQVKVGVVLRRLGYLLSILGIQKNISSTIQKEKFTGYQFLDPLADKKRLGYSDEFGLIINATNKELLRWKGY